MIDNFFLINSTNMQGTKCPNCNNYVKKGLNFCPQCGIELPKTSQDDNTEADNQTNQPIISDHTSNSSRYIFILILLLIVGIPLYLSLRKNVSDKPSISYSVIDNKEAELRKELAIAENELQYASEELGRVLPYYQNVLAQYGGGPMALIAASNNNPQLVRQFDEAEDKFERCFMNIASIYQKMGNNESAQVYRDQLWDWQKKIRRLKGMP